MNCRTTSRSPALALLLAGGLAAVFLLGGCAHQQVREKSAREWYEEGQAQAAKKRYEEAVASFREAAKAYRSADLDAEIQIALADATFAQGEYAAAAEAYAEFLRLHPHHSRSDWAQFQVGVSWMKQVRSPDRSQDPARKAQAAFETLVRSFPRSAWVKEAGDNVLVCRRRLAEHERYVADFYFRTGGFEAAARRYEVVVRQFADLGGADEALYQMVRCYEQLRQTDKASQLLEQLRREYPTSRYAKEIGNQKG